jgi:hypothetical protein
MAKPRIALLTLSMSRKASRVPVSMPAYLENMWVRMHSQRLFFLRHCLKTHTPQPDHFDKALAIRQQSQQGFPCRPPETEGDVMSQLKPRAGLPLTAPAPIPT